MLFRSSLNTFQDRPWQRHRSSSSDSSAKTLFDVLLDDAMKLIGDVVATQGHCLFPVDKDRGGWRLPRAWKADTDVRVLAFTRAVDDATHDGNFQPFNTRILFAPTGHLRAQKIVDLLRPLIAQQDNALLGTVDANLNKVHTTLAKYRNAEGFESYEKLTDTDRNALKGPITALAEDLAKLRGVLGLN